MSTSWSEWRMALQKRVNKFRKTLLGLFQLPEFQNNKEVLKAKKPVDHYVD